jgi:D-sedoheptulose 7-phosphate isomerase
MTIEINERIATTFRQTAENYEKLTAQAGEVARAADLISAAIHSGGKVMFCGNGGSAADSQHFAAELMGKFLINRAPLPAIALTVDTSALTAIGNDFSYDEVFSRQLRGIGQKGDILVGISTSGNSKNVVSAFKAAQERGITIIGLTGVGGGAMKELCDLCICVPSMITPRIQEMHLAVGHMICELVEEAFSS